MNSLPLTVPVQSLVRGALQEIRGADSDAGLDRDEAYLLARLERGESLLDILAENQNEETGTVLWFPICPECGKLPSTWAGMIRASESEAEALNRDGVYCLNHEDEDREFRPELEWKARRV